MESGDNNQKGPEQGKQPVKLQIKASEDVAKGVYSNVAFVHHNENEFVLDFVFIEPGRPQGQVVSRVISNPRAAKKLAMAIGGLVKRYEEKFGEIEVVVP